jgi:hypothetical protein
LVVAPWLLLYMMSGEIGRGKKYSRLRRGKQTCRQTCRLT